MARKECEERAEALLCPIVAEFGCRIYDVEYVKEGGEWYLRAFIDKDGGVNIDDCENVSRALSDKLDEEDFIPEAYTLEVSSPGLGRTLKKDRHLENSIGCEVEVKAYKALEDNKKEFTGVLKSYDKESITIEEPAGERTLARKDIASIKLALDI